MPRIPSPRTLVAHLVARVAEARTPRRPPLPLARLRGTAPVAVRQAMVRAHATAIPMADGAVLARILGRYGMLVDGADLAHAPHLLLDGFWEWRTTVWLARQLRPGMRFVDGGAGYGYFTLLAADLVGPTGAVVAYEPNPRLAAFLGRSAALNGFADRVRVRHTALAFGVGAAPLRLRVPAGDPLGGRLLPADLQAGQAGGWLGPDCIAVPAVALSEDDGPAPDVVKLDVPGAEEAAWRGAAPLLTARPGLRLLLAFEAARCRDPAGLLAAVAAIGPLRRLDDDGEARPCEAATLLAPGESMLLITKS